MSSDGMRGVKAADSAICLLDGEKGILAYYGYDVEDLAENASFEETCYLLLNGELPTAAQLEEFNRKLVQERDVPQEIIGMIKSFPKGADQLSCLRTAVSALGLFDKKADDLSESAQQEKSIKLMAKVPVLVAAIWRASQGEEILDSRSELPLAENFLYLMKGKQSEKSESSLLDKALTLHAEHGFNASTFSCRVTIATQSDFYSAITTGIGTLKGPLHGGANLAALKQFKEMESLFENSSEEEISKKVTAFVDDKLEKHEKIMGIGHAVYSVKDPRAIILEKYAGDLPHVNKTYLQIAKAVEERMAEKKNLFPNVDLFSGIVYEALGIDKKIFVSLFAMGRLPGWLAHVIEQIKDNKLIRPRAEYTGPQKREFVVISDR